MSKGNTGGKSTKMDAFTWLSSFRADSATSSRMSSESRPTSGPEREGSGTDSGAAMRSESRARGEEGHRDAEGSASLLDEWVEYLEYQAHHSLIYMHRIHSVVQKLTPSKVKLEKVRHDVITAHIEFSEVYILRSV